MNKCKDCRFWLKQKKQVLNQPTFGLCQRFPPVPMLNPMNMQITSAQATTPPEGTCGEFQPDVKEMM